MLFTAVAAAFAVLVFAPPAGAADSGAAALMARHRAYVGFSGMDGSVRSLRVLGQITREGNPVGRFATYRRGALERHLGDGRSTREQRGFDGTAFWSANGNGFTVNTVGEPVKILISETLLFDERLDSAAAAFVGDETVDGVKAARLHLVPEVGWPIDVWVDRESGAFRRAVIDPGGIYEEDIHIDKYVEIGDGKRIIGAWRYGAGARLYTVTSATANTVLSSTELERPRQTASWSFGSGAPVPFKIISDSIVFEASVNGHPGRFKLDSGAAGLAMTDDFVRRAGATRVGRTGIVGIGGGAAANVYLVDTFGVGDSTLRNVRVLTGLDESLAKESDGYIGFDLLAGALVDLDFDKGSFRVLDVSKVQPDFSQGYTFNVDLSQGVPRIAVMLGGTIPAIATLDSGNSYSMLFNSKALDAKGVTFITRNRARINGVSGSEIDQCGVLPKVLFGPITFGDVPSCASESMAVHDVLVGFDFLKHFNIVFDYADGKMLMVPRKAQ
ncbi:MAG TPA: aspartyl protease family protein [Candidatus Elarobacter sp.]